MKVVVKKTTNGQFRFNLVVSDGQVVATRPEAVRADGEPRVRSWRWSSICWSPGRRTCGPPATSSLGLWMDRWTTCRRLGITWPVLWMIWAI